MASDINSNQAINLVNAILGQQINSLVSWGTNNYPANSLPQWFQGPTNEIGYLAAGNPGFTGDVGAAKLRDTLINYSALFNRMCRKQIVIYYNNNEVYEVLANQTSIGNFANGVGQAAWLGSAPAPLTDISLAGLQNHINELYARWWNVAGAPVSEVLTNTVCHYSCHANCHDNRGRR